MWRSVGFRKSERHCLWMEKFRDPRKERSKCYNSQVDRCYTHPTLHSVAYVFNWASVWINPVIYICAQKKYQVTVIPHIPAVKLEHNWSKSNNFTSGCSQTSSSLQVREADLTADDQDEVVQHGKHRHKQQRLKKEHRRYRETRPGPNEGQWKPIAG